MARIKDLRFEVFGRLLVIKDSGERTISGNVIWLCICECGLFTYIASNHLKSGKIQSCGCLRKQRAKELAKNLNKYKFRHGDSRRKERTGLYNSWEHIKQRCYNPNDDYYKRYGGRGIQVHEGWKNNYLAFKKWALANGYKNGLTIDRIDNDGNYEPSNCQWLSRSENTKKYWREKHDRGR